ncbi:MAG: O-methyltransferase [Lachnospiraceae bacterium]|jgi:predicted O-methyltransferase YrrM
MDRQERISVFTDSLYKGNPKYLVELEKRARDEFVPVIRQGTQSALRTFLEMKKPERILEVGAGIGFSALFMAEFSDAGITTIELDPVRAEKARANFAEYDKEGRITLFEGDAMDVMKTLDEKFDFIFMDAAKGQYINFHSEVMRLLKSGGVLVSDNILQEGDILESHFAVERRNRTIYKRMREYLFEITHSDELTTSVFSIGDGVALSVKR